MRIAMMQTTHAEAPGDRPVMAPMARTPFGRVLVLGVCAGVVWGTAMATPGHPGARDLGGWIVTVLFLLFFPLAALRPRLTTILATGSVAVALQILTPNGAGTLAAVGAIALAAGRLAMLPGRIISGGVAIGIFGALFWNWHQPGFGEVLSVSASMFFTYVAAFSIHQLRTEQSRTAALLAEVIAGRDAQVRAAALDERARLAREVHDVLAHTLSALSIQLEGAWLLAQQRGSEPQVVTALERTSRLAKEGLLEARRAVSALREEAPPGPDLLPGLVDAFQRDTDIPATLQVEGEVRDLPPEVRLAVYRTAQEALTNILKHAEATAMTVILRYGAHDVELRIENRGRARPAPAAQGGGYGLIGLGERAALLGGRLEAGPRPDGFCVSLWVPL